MTHKTVVTRPTYRSPTYGVIDFIAGWNLISFPGIPAITDPVLLIPGGSQIQLPFYKWNPDTVGYEAVTEIQLGEGYYVRSLSDETLILNITYAFDVIINLKAGWNLIGSIRDHINVNDPQDTPDNSIQLPIFYGDVEKTVIEPWCAYWVLALNDCTLSLEGL